MVHKNYYPFRDRGYHIYLLNLLNRIMNRELKFRGWMGNKMVYTPLFSYDGLHFSTTDQIGEYEYELCVRCTAVMQYTGLKDKNGKDAYEGDIVSTGDRYEIGVIIFQAGCFMIQWYDDPEALSDILGFDKNNRPRIFEIGGNIYENAELLTKC